MRGALAAVPFVDSPAARLDARWRLAGLAALIIATAIARTLLAASIELSAVFLTGGHACHIMVQSALVPVLLILLPAALVALFPGMKQTLPGELACCSFRPSVRV